MGKNKKKVAIRLYKVHDLDLIKIYLNKQFDFRNAIKFSLYAYINKSNQKMLMPQTDCVSLKKIKGSYKIVIFFYEEDEQQLIDFISKIKIGYRTSFIKNLLRQTFVGYNVSAYFDDDTELSFFNEELTHNASDNFKKQTFVKPSIKKKYVKKEKSTDVLSEVNKVDKKNVVNIDIKSAENNNKIIEKNDAVSKNTNNQHQTSSSNNEKVVDTKLIRAENENNINYDNQENIKITDTESIVFNEKSQKESDYMHETNNETDNKEDGEYEVSEDIEALFNSFTNILNDF